jgi:hypothetical protein
MGANVKHRIYHIGGYVLYAHHQLHDLAATLSGATEHPLYPGGFQEY